jgi:hypothetical protein
MKRLRIVLLLIFIIPKLESMFLMVYLPSVFGGRTGKEGDTGCRERETWIIGLMLMIVLRMGRLLQGRLLEGTLRFWR